MSSHWAIRLVHFLYLAFTSIVAWIQGYKRKQPRPLKASRTKFPKHLCLNLVVGDEITSEETENAFLQCVQNVAAWCRELGIEMLTVYDREGFLYRCPDEVRRRVFVVEDDSENSCESEIEYPLTPPLSESSGSRSHSPDHANPPENLNTITMIPASRVRKRRNVAVRRRAMPTSKFLHVHLIVANQDSDKGTPNNMTLHIVSRASAKPAIAAAGRSLLHSYVGSVSMSKDTPPSSSCYSLTITELGTILEASLPSPDFMIIHHVEPMDTPHPPIELHGFPPWQITLTEFHRTHPDDNEELGCSGPGARRHPVLISETAFCRALDEYAGAQARLGR